MYSFCIIYFIILRFLSWHLNIFKNSIYYIHDICIVLQSYRGTCIVAIPYRFTPNIHVPIISTNIKDHTGYGLSQWVVLLCNIFSHWPNPYPEWSLNINQLSEANVYQVPKHHFKDGTKVYCAGFQNSLYQIINSPRNFLGGLVKLPASGWMTQRSSTNLEKIQLSINYWL